MTIRPTQQILRTGQRLLQINWSLHKLPCQDWIPHAFREITEDPLIQLATQLGARSHADWEEPRSEQYYDGYSLTSNFIRSEAFPGIGATPRTTKVDEWRNWRVDALSQPHLADRLAPSTLNTSIPIKPDLQWIANSARDGLYSRNRLPSSISIPWSEHHEESDSMVDKLPKPQSEELEKEYSLELSKIFGTMAALNIAPGIAGDGLGIATPLASSPVPSEASQISTAKTGLDEHLGYIGFSDASAHLDKCNSTNPDLEPIPGRVQPPETNDAATVSLDEIEPGWKPEQTSGPIERAEESQPSLPGGLRMVPNGSRLTEVLRTNVVAEGRLPFRKGSQTQSLHQRQNRLDATNRGSGSPNLTEVSNIHVSSTSQPETVDLEQILDQLTDRLEFDFIRTYGTSGG